MVITFVHAVSESLDHYYWTFRENLTDEEIQARINTEELAGDDAGFLFLSHVERVEV